MMDASVRRLVIWTALIVISSAGCAKGPDPFERTNRHLFGFNEFVDRAVLKDVAMGYERNVPEPVRDSVDNFFNNLGYLNVIVNDHLQGRFAQGWRNTERMAVNSTIGVLGLFDPAEEMGRPRERNDFGITLGRWGVGAGPYLMLPLLGPSSGRDLPALVVARVTNPMFWLNPPLVVSIPMDVVSVVDQRARLQPQVELRDRAALDKYTFTRDVYLSYRAAVIGEDLAVPDGEDDFFEEEAPPMSVPSATDYIR